MAVRRVEKYDDSVEVVLGLGAGGRLGQEELSQVEVSKGELNQCVVLREEATQEDA